MLGDEETVNQPELIRHEWTIPISLEEKAIHSILMRAFCVLCPIALGQQTLSATFTSTRCTRHMGHCGCTCTRCVPANIKDGLQSRSLS